MATAKQYELLFMLKAQMDSAFGIGFATAKTYLTQMQAEVKQYNHALRDIDGYKKHITSIETLRGKLATEQQALDAVNQKIRANGTATKEDTAEQRKHEAQVNRLNQQIRNKIQALEADRAALQKDGVSTENLDRQIEELKAAMTRGGDAIQNVTLDINALSSEEEKLNQSLSDTQSRIDSWTGVVNTVTDVSNALNSMKIVTDQVANGVMAMNNAIMDCIQGAGELEYTMSGVAAVSGANTEETAQLSALAKELGANTVYTASEVANAMQAEALAGWSVNEMLNGMTAVTKLAAASGEDLESMASIVSDSLNAFGLSGEAAVNKFADVLTKSATSSNTTVGLLGESLSYVESTAANLDYSIEDVGVALAVMANNALKGSVSGSALNTMLTRMSGANSNAAGQMEALGLSMYDSSGRAKDLMTFMNELRETFKQFGDNAQDAQNAAYNLAGQRGMRGLLAITNTTDKEWKQMVEDVYDYEGAAESISDIRLDNYRGQIYLLESAWDALKTTVGEQFLPTATDAAGVLTNLCNVANDFVAENGSLVVGFTAGAETALVFASAIRVAATAAMALKFALQTLSAAQIAMAKTAGVIGLVVSAVAAVGVGLYDYYSKLDLTSEAVRDLRDETDALLESTEASNSAYKETIAGYEAERDSALALVNVLDELMSKSKTAWNKSQIQDVVSQLNEANPSLDLEYDVSTGSLNKDILDVRGAIIEDSFSKTIDTQRSALTDLYAQKDQIKGQLELATGAYAEAKSEWGAIWNDENQSFIQSGGDYSQIQADYETTKTAMEELRTAYDETASQIEEYEKAIKAEIQTQMEEQGVTGLATEQYEELDAALNGLKEAYEEAYDAAYKSISGQISLTKEQEEVEKTSAKKMAEAQKEQAKQQEQYVKDLQTLKESGIDMSDLTQYMDGSSDSMSYMNALAEDIRKNGGTYVQQVVDALKSEFENADVAAGLVAGMSEGVQEATIDVADVLQFDTEEAQAQGLEVAQNVVQGMIDGLTGGGDAQETARTMTTNMMDAIKTAAGTHSPSTITYEVGQNVDEGLINGLDAKAATAASKAAEIAGSVTTSFQNGMPYSTFYSLGAHAVQGVISGLNSKLSALKAAMAHVKSASKVSGSTTTTTPATSGKTGYATGTSSAEAGLKVVGENGPELVQFAGGERVYNAAETNRILGNMPVTEPVQMNAETYSTTDNSQTMTAPVIHYSPVITVQGNADKADIMDALTKGKEDLEEFLEQWFEQYEASARRRAY